MIRGETPEEGGRGEPGLNLDGGLEEVAAHLVGLYFDDLATDGWSTPDGSDPKSYWRYLRGDDTHPVRAVYEVPADRGFTVGDVTVNGKPIRFGAQIADFITIKLTAVACRLGQSTTLPKSACVEFPRTAAAALVDTVRGRTGYLAAPTTRSRR
ncbi:hypothetical protein AB0442_38350 [Kitasatospora sp. NPDC085895]|uniref:hypothetical protein n=1 Tax=Kitasatospora sp. NPDC085895 TaxID=3155057 RepID=UPI00344C8FCD